MLKPKYIENILSITKEKCGEIECDVVCECGARHFVGYKNVIVKNIVASVSVMKTVFLTFTQ